MIPTTHSFTRPSSPSLGILFLRLRRHSETNTPSYSRPTEAESLRCRTPLLPLLPLLFVTFQCYSSIYSPFIQAYAALFELRSGEHENIKFHLSSVEDVYVSHLTTLATIRTEHLAMYRRILSEIYASVRCVVINCVCTFIDIT